MTILDVAHAAGVQPSTVSKALNDRQGSPDVRRRVEEAAARLGYRPNQLARGLRRSESRSIGVLIPDLANPVFVAFLRGAERAAQERGYVVLIADGQRSDETTVAALERFFDRGVDGLLLGGPVPAHSLSPYLDHGVAVAPSMSDHERSLARHWEQGEADATLVMGERLLQLGHRRFTFVATPPPIGQTGRRYRRGRLGALATILRPAGAELAISLVDPTLGFEEGRAELQRALADGPPTALICGNHLLAPWLLIALAEAGLHLPGEVSLVVYGDSDWARAYRPPLSVIRRDTYAEGYDLATSLLDAVAGVVVPRRTMAPAQFVERGSCGPPRTGRSPGPAAQY